MKAASFCADNPKLSFETGSKLIDLASYVFAPLAPLLEAALNEAKKAQVLGHDGASNLCADTGKNKSVCARFLADQKAKDLPATTEWGMAHKLNLTNSDMIKVMDSRRPGVIQTIRQTKSFLSRSAAHTNELAQVLSQEHLDLKDLVDATDHLERHIKSSPPPFTPAEVQEIQDLQKELDAKNLTKQEFKAKLTDLGKRSALAGYIVVRWYSLFNSATALVKLEPFLTKMLQKLITEKKTKTAVDADDEADKRSGERRRNSVCPKKHSSC